MLILARLLLRSVQAYRGWLAGVLLLQVLLAAGSLALPALNAAVIDRGVLQQRTDEIWLLGGLMLGATALEGGVALAAVYCSARLAVGVGRDLRGALFTRAVELSALQVDEVTPGSLITRVTNDVQQVQLLLLSVCNVLLLAPLTIGGATLLAASQDVGMVWVLALTVPLVVVPLGLVVRSLAPASELMQERTDQVNRLVREQVIGLRVVRAFAREPQEQQRFAAVNAGLSGALLTSARRMALILPVMMIAINLSSIAVLLVGAGRVESGALTIGAMVAFLSYLGLALTAVVISTFVVMMLPRAAVCARRMQDVLDLRPTQPAESRDHLPQDVQVVRFEGVRFQYAGAAAPVLSDVHLTFRRGETTAVVGSTGAGKTTLLNLIPRLLEPTGGRITAAGIDLRDVDPQALRDRIGLVPQRPYLFSGTIASNLEVGRPDATPEQMWEALAVAQADGFVRELPGGLQARVEQGGSNLSGGQRQRIALARALVRQPDVYLFDDCFSALDLATEMRLRQALVPWTSDAVVVLVAQRAATFTAADQVVVLEDGRVVGCGSPDELAATCSTYAEILASQPREQAVR